MPILQYRLPVSRIRMSGTYTATTDKILGEQPIERTAVAELGVMADPVGPYSVDLDAGWLRDSSATFALTEDGRLTSATVSAIGQGGTLVSGIVGVAATAIGTVIRAASGVPRVERADGEKDEGPPPPLTPRKAAEKLEATYRAEHPEEAAVRTAARDTLKKLRAQHQAALDLLANADAPEQRIAALKQAQQIGISSPASEASVDRADALFDAWHATKVTSAVTSYTIDVTLDEIRAADVTVVDGKPVFPEHRGSASYQARVQAAQDKIRQGWEKLGCLVLVHDDPLDEETYPGIPADGRMRVVVRRMRPVLLDFYEVDTNDRAKSTAQRPAMILDRLCPTETIEVSSGVFGKNSRGITFSSEGVPTGFDYGSGSAAAAAATSLAGIPATVAGALETLGKINTAVDALRNSRAEQALAQAKRATDLKQQQVTLDGLTSTEKNFGELESLKQQAAIKAQNDLLHPAQPTVDPVEEQIRVLRQRVELAALGRLLDQLG